MEIKPNEKYQKRLGRYIEKDLEGFEYNPDKKLHGEHKFDKLVSGRIKDLNAEYFAKLEKAKKSKTWDSSKPYIGWSQPNPDLTGSNNI